LKVFNLPWLKQPKMIGIWTFFIFGFFSVQEKTNWPLLRFSGIRSFSFFTDLGWVFKTADSARVIGWDIYEPNPPKDYSAYLYGSNLIRAVNFLGITEAQTKIIGWILMLLFSALIGTVMSLLKDNGILASIFCFSLLISPPNQLLIERGNFDLVIILSLSIISFLIMKNKYYYSLLILFVITSFKFYTIPIFVYLIYLSKSKFSRFVGASLLVTSGFLVINDLSKIKIDFPRPSWAAFGNPIFGIYFHRFGVDLPTLVQDLIGLISLAFALIIIKTFLNLQNFILPETSILKSPKNFKDSIFNVYILTFLICYFSSTNFDYRLIYLIIPALIYINMLRSSKMAVGCLGILLALTGWLSYNSGDWQLLGDLCILFWVGIFVRSVLIELQVTRFNKFKTVNLLLKIFV